MELVHIEREDGEGEVELFDNLERLGAANPDAEASAYVPPAPPEPSTHIEVAVMFVLDDEQWCPRLA